MAIRFFNPYFKKPPQHTSGRIAYWFKHQEGWAYVVSIVLLLSIIIYVAVQRQWLWIQNVSVTGNQYITASQLQDPAWEVLNGKRWFIFPERVYIFSDTNAIYNRIHDQLSNTVALKSLTVEKEFPNTIVITVEERVPGLAYTINNQHYYLDEEGVATEQISNEVDLNLHFPRIRDENTKRSIKLNDLVLKPSVIAFIIALHEQFTPVTNMNISEYRIKTVSCQQKQYVAEKIFADEINNSKNEKAKNEKVSILERLKKNEITVDQSLDLLEDIKRNELGGDDQDPTVGNEGNEAFIQLQAQYVEADCDYPAVIQDVALVAQNGPQIYFDTTLDLQQQLYNLEAVIQDTIKTENISKLKYIDVRFKDRVYYQ